METKEYSLEELLVIEERQEATDYILDWLDDYFYADRFKEIDSLLQTLDLSQLKHTSSIMSLVVFSRNGWNVQPDKLPHYLPFRDRCIEFFRISCERILGTSVPR